MDGRGRLHDRAGAPARPPAPGASGSRTACSPLGAGHQRRTTQRRTRLRARHARLRIGRRGPGRPRTRPGRVLADKAYSSRGIRSHLRRRGIQAVIPEPADQARHRKRRGSTGGRPLTYDVDAYRLRNTVERAINKLRGNRAVATRFDKHDYVYRGTVDAASIRIWLHDPVT